MGTVTIRNLDDEVIERLKARAKANHRSLEAEVRAMLERAALEARPLTAAEFFELADRIAARTRDVPQTDSALLLREDRDR